MHLGRNVSKLRELKGIKQEDFAKMLKITQQAVSKLESKKEIDDATLNKIADKLGLKADAIKEFNPDAVVQNIQQHTGNLGNVIGYNINPVDKIVELYEKLLKEKDSIIKSQKKEIETLKRNAKSK